MNLYTKEGWLDIPALSATGCWLYVIIGKRQVGKTYGVIKFLLKSDAYHIYMRRTAEELDTVLSDPDLNPYLKMEREGYQVGAVRLGKNYAVGDVDSEGKLLKRRGIALPLSGLFKIRGFDADRYSDLILDEFVPEEIAIVREAEGSALVNALITINANRELEGRPPLRVWLLANSNRLNSPIMRELGLIPIIEKMMREKQEVYTDGEMFVFRPESKVVSEKREETAVIRFLRKNNPQSRILKMAMNNEFPADETAYVSPRSLQGYKPLTGIDSIYIYESGDNLLYICGNAHKKGKHYSADKQDVEAFRLKYPLMKLYYVNGRCRFDSATSLFLFKKYCDIK